MHLCCTNTDVGQTFRVSQITVWPVEALVTHHGQGHAHFRFCAIFQTECTQLSTHESLRPAEEAIHRVVGWLDCDIEPKTVKVFAKDNC